MLHIQCDDRFPSFQKVEQKQFHEVAFSLTGVAENQHVGRGFILVALVEIDHNIAAVLVLPDVEALTVCLAGVVEREQVCDRAGWQDTLILRAESVETDRADRAEACLLAELQLVHVQFRAHELDLHIRLQNLQLLHISRDHFDVDSAVQQRFFVSVQRTNEVCHILQIALRFHCLLHIL